MNDTALEIIDTTAQLTVRRDPTTVLAEAQKAAIALKDVIDKKPKKVMMNGEQYLEFEDWQTLARFYGLSVKVKSTEYVEYGGTTGFSAVAAAIRAEDGMEISIAEASCLNDEPKWSSRAVYDWVDAPGGGREKKLIGSEPVPKFQLKSMAQTRACAKALRNVLSWVVVLAGYKATPAEELDTHDDGRERSGSTAVSGDATTATSQAVRADGVTTVVDVQVMRKPAGRAGKDWTLFTVIFADGRKAGTFDEKLRDRALTLKTAATPIVPEIIKDEKDRMNLKGFLDAPKEPEAEAADVPEKVLVVRETRRGYTLWFVIQGSEKEYITDRADLAVTARSIKANTPDAHVWFRYDRRRTTQNETVRLLKAIEDVMPSGESTEETSPLLAAEDGRA